MNEFVHNYFIESPFFTSVAPFAAQLHWSYWPTVEDYYAQLNRLGAPIQFVAQANEQAYELQIAQSGQVPTRYGNWHDYFNALCWCAFPRVKSAFNRLHQQHWQSSMRTRPRDGLTLLDESGVIVLSDDETLLQLIATMNWPELFVTRRENTRTHLKVLLIGHGLMEKCLAPYIGMTAHARLMLAPSEIVMADCETQRQWCDQNLSADLLKTKNISPAELFPLPLLGIPNWWAANEQPTFYDNIAYFRRSRRRQNAT